MLTASSPDTYELTHGLEECGMTVSYDGTEGTINFSVSEIGQEFFRYDHDQDHTVCRGIQVDAVCILIFERATYFKLQSQMTVPGILDESGMIMTTQPIEWTFECSFDASYDIEADEMTMDSTARTGDFVGTGQFDLSLDFYATDTFETTTDAANQIGNMVNFGSEYLP